MLITSLLHFVASRRSGRTFSIFRTTPQWNPCFLACGWLGAGDSAFDNTITPRIELSGYYELLTKVWEDRVVPPFTIVLFWDWSESPADSSGVAITKTTSFKGCVYIRAKLTRDVLAAPNTTRTSSTKLSWWLLRSRHSGGRSHRVLR